MNIQRPIGQNIHNQIKQLKQLFFISTQICYQRASQLITRHPNNLQVVQINAACQSLLGKHQQALVKYQKCLQIANDYKAFLNNLAWNQVHRQRGDFQVATAYLNDIGQQWNHPSIYLNLAYIYQKYQVKKVQLLDEALAKTQNYRYIYPKFDQQFYKGLIHTFSLQPQEHYTGKVTKFGATLQVNIKGLQKMLQKGIDYDQLTSIFEDFKEKLDHKNKLQNLYGILLPKWTRIKFDALQILKNQIISDYLKSWGKQKQIQQQIIYSLRILNENIFSVNMDGQYSYEQLKNNITTPLQLQLQELTIQIRDKVRRSKERIQMKQIRKPEVIQIIDDKQPQVIQIQPQEKKYEDIIIINQIDNQNELNKQLVEGLRLDNNEQRQKKQIIDLDNNQAQDIQDKKDDKQYKQDDKQQIDQFKQDQKDDHNQLQFKSILMIQQKNMNEQKQVIQQLKDKNKQNNHQKYQQLNQYQQFKQARQINQKQDKSSKNQNNHNQNQQDQIELLKLRQQQRLRQSNRLRQQQKLKQYRKKDEQIRNNQNIKQQNQFNMPQYPSGQNYKYFVRLSDAEQFQGQNVSIIQSRLKISGQTVSNPLFIIYKGKTKYDQFYNVYLNTNRIKNQLLSLPLIPNLANLKNSNQVKQIYKYYYLLNTIFKFYSFYTNNQIQYHVHNISTNIQFNHYIQLITPVFNQIFSEEQLFKNNNFGYIFYTIHYSIAQYLTQTQQNGQYLKLFNTILKRISLITNSNQSIVSLLFDDILLSKHQMYVQALLSHQLQSIDGSTIYHEYFNWKITKFYKLNSNPQIRNSFRQQEDWVISNISLLIISLTNQKIDQQGDILCQAFSDCFYQSINHQSQRNKILKKFYYQTHNVSKINKGIKTIRKWIKKILI